MKNLKIPLQIIKRNHKLTYEGVEVKGEPTYVVKVEGVLLDPVKLKPTFLSKPDNAKQIEFYFKEPK